MTHPIIEFIEARLREREDAAERARGIDPGEWAVYGNDGVGEGPNSLAVEWAGYGIDDALDHIALNDPAYVLADVAVKRAILAEHAPMPKHGKLACSCCGNPPGYDFEWMFMPCPTLRLLASPWNGHPGYRAEWAPDVTTEASA